MEYHTVFDVIQNGVHWLGRFVIFVAAALFLLIGWVLRQTDERNASARGLIFQAGGGIGVLSALAFLLRPLLDTTKRPNYLLTAATQ
jgi:cytochrome b561